MSGVVVDTSIWIDYFAGREVSGLEEALAQGSVLVPPIVIAELVSGAHRPRDRAALVGFLGDLAVPETPPGHWVAVGDLRRECRQKGLSVSTPDAHVAQCALERNALLFTRDKVFRHIAKIRDLRVSGGEGGGWA